MKNKDKLIKITVYAVAVSVIAASAFSFTEEMLRIGADLALLSLQMMLPVSDEEASEQETTVEKIAENESTTEKAQAVIKTESFAATPKDIESLIKKAQETGEVVSLCCAIGDTHIDGIPFGVITRRC